MRRLRILLSLFAALTVTATAPSALASQGTPGSRGMEMADQRQLAVDGVPIALSPDGAWLAGLDRERQTFCVWDVESLQATCDGEVDAVVPDTITWAPDSSAVAFSEDAPRFFVDSDIFVFEVETGTLHNLTDDGDAQLSILEPSVDPIDIDLAPSWSPDSQHLVFSRTTYAEAIEDPGTVLMTIPRSGGEPEEILRLAPPYPLSVYTTMSWQEDDSILLSIWKADPADGQLGIWRTSLNGGIDLVIPGTERDEMHVPVIADAHEERISLISLGHMYMDDEAYTWLADSDGSSLMPVEEALNLPADTRVVTAPSFAPTGDEIAFVARQPDGTFTLMVGSPASGESTSIATLSAPLSSEAPIRPIDWATNNTIFIATSDGGTLITLAP